MSFSNPLLIILLPAILWLIGGPFYIGFLKSKMFGQYIREDGPQSHHKKTGTPTMGGLLILATVLVVLAIWLTFKPYMFTPNLAWALLVLIVFGFLGFSDDYLKITKKKNKGISGWSKLACQLAIGLMIGVWIKTQAHSSVISVFNWQTFDLGWLYPIFATLVITGSSNAYNLTDGLDGLAGGTGLITFLGFYFLLGGYPELQLFSLLLAGGCLGFLIFNRHPARIFMGDTGSLALGGVMGAFAVLGKVEFFLLLLGGVYVIETLSVILQVIYFKATHGRRLFKMSPIHHHFELSGWKEPLIVFTFTIIQALFSLMAVLLYNKS